MYTMIRSIISIFLLFESRMLFTLMLFGSVSMIENYVQIWVFFMIFVLKLILKLFDYPTMQKHYCRKIPKLTMAYFSMH